MKSIPTRTQPTRSFIFRVAPLCDALLFALSACYSEARRTLKVERRKSEELVCSIVIFSKG